MKGCPINYFTVPVTFKTKASFVRLQGYVEGSYSLNVRFEFRTYQVRSLIFMASISRTLEYLWGWVQARSIAL